MGVVEPTTASARLLREHSQLPAAPGEGGGEGEKREGRERRGGNGKREREGRREGEINGGHRN